jgi:hypothetical protein
MSGKKFFPNPHPSARQHLWEKYGLRNKNFLQGIGFGRAILADTPQIKRG